MRLQFIRQSPLQPVQLQLGGSEQLANVVMQFTAQVLAFALLHLEHAIGQFRRAHADRPGAVAQVPADAEGRDQLQQQQAGRKGLRDHQRQIGDQRHHAQRCCRPAQQSGAGTATQRNLQAWGHR
ncbi:hypothetical protein D3C76_1492770 [compost metagenome]